MKITGYQIKETLKLKHIALSTLVASFDDSLYAYEGDKKELPQDIMKQVLQLEKEMCELQTAQKAYNLQNRVSVETLGDISLEYAIKVVGAYGRQSKKFRDCAKGEQERRSRYDSGPSSRSKDDEYQKPTIARIEAMYLAIEAETTASKLRAAIAKANSIEIDIVELKPTLF